MDTHHPQIRSFPLIAWLIILIVCGWMVTKVVRNTLGLEETPATEGSTAALSLQSEQFLKIMVGARELLNVVGSSPQEEMASLLLERVQEMKQGTPEERLSFALLHSEYLDAASTMKMIVDDSLWDDPDETAEPWSEEERELASLLDLILTDRAAENFDLPSLNEISRARILELGGWGGQLVLLPPESDDQTARQALFDSLLIIPIVGVIVLGIIGCFGLAGLVIGGILLFRIRDGRVNHGFQIVGQRGGLYAETFALWILVFSLWQVGGKVAADQGWIVSESLSLAYSLVGFFFSLVALGWPVLRGVSWADVKKDIGWTKGRGLGFETFIGGAMGYALAIPIAAIGFGCTMALLALQKWLFPDAPPPSHPIQGMAGSGNLSILIMLYVLGCVAAPIIEETMFRGVLYRHLREASNGLHVVMSFLLTSFVTSFVFAAIHPQGLAVVPSLMALAIGFCLIREWRGSLAASIFAHGLHNFLLISLTIALFGLG